MKAPLIVVSVTAIALLVTVSAPAEEFKLEYRSSDNPQSAGIITSSKATTPLPKLPDGVSLPENAGVEPVFAKWQTPLAKEGFVYLAAAKSSETSGYDKVFVDADCDGNLPDESPLSPTDRAGVFGPVEVVFPRHDVPLRYRIKVAIHSVEFFGRGTHSDTSLNVEPACWYEGNVTLDGKEYRVALVDGTADGSFDDTSMDLSKVDYIAVGDKGSKVLDHRCMGKYIQMGGKIYRPRPPRFGGSIEFVPAEPFATGVVQATHEATSLTLAGENGELSFDLVNRKAQFPVGKWMPKSWALERKDAGGVPWTLEGQGFPAKAVFDITAGTEAALDIGEPVNARVAWAGYFDGEEQKPVFAFTMGGRLGEVIHVTRNGARPPAPILRIRSADGAFDESVAFEYG